jgi:hypothetical protein
MKHHDLTGTPPAGGVAVRPSRPHQQWRMKMRKLMTTAALLLFVAVTPAWATTEEVLQVTAALAVYEHECGPLSPKMQAMADVLYPIYATNKLDVVGAMLDVQRLVEVAGKETFCRKMLNPEQ